MVVVDLFESEECKTRLRQNIDDTEFQKIYGEVSRGESYMMTSKAKGEHVTQKQIVAFTIPVQRKAIGGYKRNIYGKEVSVRNYEKSYRKWGNDEIRFLRVRKEQGVLTPKQISYEYNKHFAFKNQSRSSSSIKTQLYRIST
jgi:hypothetical protein